jgi:hypothetical protein
LAHLAPCFLHLCVFLEQYESLMCHAQMCCRHLGRPKGKHGRPLAARSLLDFVPDWCRATSKEQKEHQLQAEQGGQHAQQVQHAGQLDEHAAQAANANSEADGEQGGMADPPAADPPAADLAQPEVAQQGALEVAPAAHVAQLPHAAQELHASRLALPAQVPHDIPEPHAEENSLGASSSAAARIPLFESPLHDLWQADAVQPQPQVPSHQHRVDAHATRALSAAFQGVAALGVAAAPLPLPQSFGATASAASTVVPGFTPGQSFLAPCSPWSLQGLPQSPHGHTAPTGLESEERSQLRAAEALGPDMPADFFDQQAQPQNGKRSRAASTSDAPARSQAARRRVVHP